MVSVPQPQESYCPVNFRREACWYKVNTLNFWFALSHISSFTVDDMSHSHREPQVPAPLGLV